MTDSYATVGEALYCDGGVTGRNPSTIGGPWAWIRISHKKNFLDTPINFGFGITTPEKARMDVITNNLTEMLAALKGIDSLPPTWSGTIYSDSSITLGRLFAGEDGKTFKWNNIPAWMQTMYREQGKMHYWGALSPVLLSGHPTKEQLISGIGKRGTPVSKWNVWCDKVCGELSCQYQSSNREEQLAYDKTKKFARELAEKTLQEVY